jgi:predicted phosphohydrolase
LAPVGRIFAIGDPHLSSARPKPMDIFGAHWENHAERFFDAARLLVSAEDLLIVAGDISWAMKLDEALPDLDDIGELPGRKLLLKGNHDYWWQSRSKIERAVHSSISLLHCDSFVFGDVAIAGGRGWTLPGDEYFTDEDERIYRREVERIRLSLESLEGKRYERLLAALHFPPMNSRHESTEVTGLLERYGVEVCIYGHLHGDGIRAGFEGVRNGVRYKLLSADSVGFVPVEVYPGLFAA